MRRFSGHMFHVKCMSTEDFEFAVNLTNQMDWKLSREDFELMLKLEPQGSFVLLDNSERVGISTTVSFGKIGWFGNLLVSRGSRQKGGGSQLVRQSIEYLKSKNVETIGLYAYTDKIPFYEQLGFKYDSEFVVLKGKDFSPPVKSHLEKAEKKDVRKIIACDRLCFGESREKLLKPIILDPDNLCYAMIDDGQVLGYSVAKVYRGMAEVGPLVSLQGRNDIAIALLNAVLNKLKDYELSLCAPRREEAIINALKEHGFREDFRVSRMFLGPPAVNSCIYIAESLERG